MLLSLKEARALARDMGLDDKAISRLRLRDNMEASAVQILVSEARRRILRSRQNTKRQKPCLRAEQ